MSELARRNTVTFKIGHDCLCPCPCCHRNQAIEYSLLIVPWHLRDQSGLAPAVRPKRDELWALLSVTEKKRPSSVAQAKALAGRTTPYRFGLWRNHDVACRAAQHESWNYEPSGRPWSHRAT